MSKTAHAPLTRDSVRIEPQLHYVDGEFRASRSGATFETLDPTTIEPFVGR